MAKRITFEVKGLFPFPIDMLRYDAAYPDTDADATVIEETVNGLAGESGGTPHRKGPRTIRLGLSGHRPAVPTAKRWKSFGWEVVGYPCLVSGLRQDVRCAHARCAAQRTLKTREERTAS